MRTRDRRDGPVGIRALWALLAALVLAIGLAACGDDDSDDGGSGESSTEAEAPPAEVEQYPANTTMGKIQEEGELVVGVKFDVPPFGIKDPSSGDVVGFDVDMAQTLADALGVELKTIEAITDNRIPFLVDGTVDVVLSTFTMTAERDEEVDFSKPYFLANGRLLVPEGSDIAAVADIDDGKKVCTTLGATFEDILSSDYPGAEATLVDSFSECLELVQNGAVDAVMLDEPALLGFILQDETLSLVGESVSEEPYGAGVPDGDAEMVDFVNEVFDEVKSDGRWAEIYENRISPISNEDPPAPPEVSNEEAYELTG